VQEQEGRDNAAYVRRVHDKGLTFDMCTMSRRRLLAAFGGAGALALIGGAAACDGTAEGESSAAGTGARAEPAQTSTVSS